MIRSPKVAHPAADVGNVQPRKVATNQRAVPLPYFFGRRWLPLMWAQSNIYNPKTSAVTSKVGKTKQITGYDYYGDLFGLVGCCQVDFFEALKVNGKVVWSGFIERDGGHVHSTGTVDVPGVCKFRFHWGTPNSTAAEWLLLGTCGETHPLYLDQPKIEIQQCYFGNNNATPPNIEVLVERAPRFAGLDENRTREGASPVTGIAEVIADDFYGLNRPDLIHVATWAALGADIKRELPVAVPGDPDHIASMGYVSGYVDRIQAVQSFIAQCLENFDGWLRRKGAQIEIGRFPHDGVVPGGLPELSFHDFIEAPAFEADDDSDGDVITDAVVTHVERDNDMEEDSQPATNAAARDRLGEIREKQFPRPFIITGYQAREQAGELAKFYARPEEKSSVPIRRERIVGLRAGDRFKLNDAPSSSLTVVRIVDRRDDSHGGRVQLALVQERGLAPLGYSPVPEQQPALPDPDLVAIVNARMFQLPAQYDVEALGVVPAVVALAERPAAHTAGFHLAFSTAGVTYDEIARELKWALRGTLNAGITNAATVFIVNAGGLDIALLAAQSAAAKDDDTLLLFCGFEIMSIGDVAALGGGQYQLTVFRGRRGSVADAHAGAAECWIVPRADLTILQHADFPRGIATRYFKLPTFTTNRAGGEEQELADALALTLTFDDTDVSSPSPLSAVAKAEAIFISWALPAPPEDSTIVATDIWELSSAVAPDPSTTPPTWSIRGNGFNRGGLAAGTTKYYYALNRDTRGNRSSLVGPASASALAAATGPAGPVGPGLVFVGDYNAANIYYKTAERIDVVRYGGNFYPAANAAKSGTATWGAPGGADWGAAFVNFDAVAVRLLLAFDATIIKTLVMGDGATGNGGIIRSAGATAYGTGKGFWMNPRNGSNNTEIRAGDPAGAQLAFDGANLTLGSFGVSSGSLSAGSGSGSVTLSSSSSYLLFGQVGITQCAVYANNGLAVNNGANGQIFLGVSSGAGRLKLFNSGGTLKFDVDGASGDIVTSGDIYLGNGTNRWIYDGAGNRILQQRYPTAAPVDASDLATAIALANWLKGMALHHGLGA